MKAVLVFASGCICVDAVNIHTFFLCLSVFGLTCFTRVFAYSCVRVNGVYTCLLGLSEFKLTWFTGTCFCSVCVWYEVVDTCFYVTWALIEASDTRLCLCFCLGWRSAQILCLACVCFEVVLTCFLGWGTPDLFIYFFFFSAFVFDELVGVCFCLYSGTSI